MALQNLQFINAHAHHPSSENELCVQNILAHQFDETQLDENQLYSIGIHPLYINTDKLDEELEIVEKAIQRDNVIAVGECGLDRSISENLELQTQVFVKQIEIADKANKPVVIHCVRAYSDIVHVKKSTKNNVQMILHGFYGNKTMTVELLKHGFVFSFGAGLFANKSKIPDIFSRIPDEVFLLETDAANISISEAYSKAAELRLLSVDEMKLLINTNFKRIFGTK